MLDTALVFRFASSAARLERCSGPGDPPEGRRPCVGGRWDTPARYPLVRKLCHQNSAGDRSCAQSCTKSETLGLATRLLVFFDAGFVVITMTGAVEYGEEGRYV